MFRVWDVEMLGLTRICGSGSKTLAFSFLGIRISRTTNNETQSSSWSKSPNHKMAAIMLMVSFCCGLIYTESHQPISAFLAFFLSPMAVLSLTEILLSYRFIIALIEAFSGLVNGLIGLHKGIAWGEFISYFSHYRIALFVLSLLPVILEFHPLAVLILTSAIIEYIDAYFSEHGLFTLRWDYFNISCVILGYSNTKDKSVLDRFTLFSINWPLASSPADDKTCSFISNYYADIAQSKGLSQTWEEEQDSPLTVIR
jgi:hypothetical protein